MPTLDMSASKSSTIKFGHTQTGPYYWVGHSTNGIDYYAGQTFKPPAKGTLKQIKIFATLVHKSVNATLSVYAFDEENYQWKYVLTQSNKLITKALENQWINFELPAIEMNKDVTYGFKLTCNGDGMLAIAECPWNISNPYPDGEEWMGSSSCTNGKFQKEFDFAFEAEINASANAKFI